MVKSEKFGHLHLVYHCTVPLRYQNYFGLVRHTQAIPKPVNHQNFFSGHQSWCWITISKVNSNDQVALETYVEESKNLIGREPFRDITQETNFFWTSSLRKKLEDHYYFHIQESTFTWIIRGLPKHWKSLFGQLFELFCDLPTRRYFLSRLRIRHFSYFMTFSSSRLQMFFKIVVQSKGLPLL